jgi:hypothetical protein
LHLASEEEGKGGWAVVDPQAQALPKRKRCSHVASADQGSLHSVLAHSPTTASSARFCLLCCQPEPIPRSLAARMSQFTPWDPCRLLAWSGQAISTVCRTWSAPLHFTTNFSKATGDLTLPTKSVHHLSVRRCRLGRTVLICWLRTVSWLPEARLHSTPAPRRCKSQTHITHIMYITYEHIYIYIYTYTYIYIYKNTHVDIDGEGRCS